MQDSLFVMIVKEKFQDPLEIIVIVIIMLKSYSERVDVPDIVSGLHEKIDNMQEKSHLADQ